MSALLELLKSSSAFSGGNVSFLESLYEQYLVDPSTIPKDWRERFDQLPGNQIPEKPHAAVQRRFLQLTQEKPTHHPVDEECLPPIAAEQQAAVLRLINGYRFRGHQHADLDPLNLRSKVYIPDLDLGYHQLDKVLNSTYF